MKLRRVFTIFLCILLIAGFSLSVAADGDERLPVPDWVTVQQNSDASKSVIITTPTYMRSYIEYYEYSIDMGFTWNILSNISGGEFVITETCEFSLRYICEGVSSEIYSVTVEISKTIAVTSDSTGITMLIPRNSGIPTDVTLSAYEIISGLDYAAAEAAIGKNKQFLLFSVTIMRNNRLFTSDVPVQWLFPVRDFDSRYCKIYHIEANGALTEIEAVSEMRMLTCTTSYTGKFAVVEDKTNAPGDVNGDALVNAADARLALRAAARLETLSEVQRNAADIDGNGHITSSDARMILRLAAGLEMI